MSNLQDILAKINQPQEYSQKYKILIYGPSGVGKTMLYDGIENALILDVEEGTSVLMKKDEMTASGTRIFPLKSWEELQDIFTLIQNGDLQFANIVLDSVTDIQELCKDHVLITQDRRRISPETPSQQDYGVISERMRKMLRNFRALNSNIIYIARERITKAEDTGEERVRPDVSGRLQDDLPGAMDVTVYMTSKEGVRYAVFNLEGKQLAKDRTHQFPRVLENPTWADFEKALPALRGPERTKDDLSVPLVAEGETDQPEVEQELITN